MGKYLAVLTATLFLFALVKCCVAAGGSTPSEDPASAYLIVMITNKLLYDLTSQDSSYPTESVVKQWITGINSALRTRLQFTQRLARCLINRANYLRTKSRSRMGGRARQRFFSTVWTLKLSPGELDDTLSEENSRLQQEVVTLQGALQTSSQILREIQPGSGGRKRTAKHYSKRHQRRLKRQRVSECTAALSWLEDEGLTPVKVIVMDKETNQLDSIVLRSEIEKALDVGDEQVSDQDVDMISMMLYVKDKYMYNVSGTAYHEMASLCHEMPRHYRLKQRISELNSKWNIRPTPEGTLGVQQPLLERLQLCAGQLVESSPPDASFIKDRKLRVKLTGDGTNIGKHLHVVNFAFTILEEGDKAHSVAGNHCIAIFKEPESYDSIKLCLEDIVQDVKGLNTIHVLGYDFNVEFYLGGDWKFLAMVTGIDSATSTHACIWCKCPSLERYNCSQTWSISDSAQGARTIEENLTIARSRSKKYNVSREPIFESIPLTRVVIDNLHMFLRVADTLIDLLLLELRRLDKIDKATKVKSLDQLQYIKKFEHSVKSLGISGFSFWIGRESKKLKCRTLTGPEKLILFDKLNIVDTFPQVPNCDKVQILWRELLIVNRLLSVRPSEVSERTATQFEDKSKEFVRKFIEIYPSKHVTPYMHAMMMHVSQFMEIHGAILPFTQHGMEKYNDSMTKDYFRSSSHRGQECLAQILQKQNRLEHLEHAGARRTKRYTVKCGNCSEQGHNHGTCSKPCSTCQHTPYCEHLVLLNDKRVPRCHS